MKMVTVIALVSVLLFSVILGAGCTSVFDPIIGTWQLTEPTETGTAETGGGAAYLSFYANGKGLEKITIISDVRAGSSFKAGVARTSFDWIKDDTGNYVITFPESGDTISNALDTTTGTLTTNWGVYRKIE